MSGRYATPRTSLLYRSHTQKHAQILARTGTSLSYTAFFLSLTHSLILSLSLSLSHAKTHQDINTQVLAHIRTFHGRIINKDIRDVKRTSSSKSDIVLLDLNATLVLDVIHFCSL